MLDELAHDFESLKQWFWKVYPNIAYSTFIFLDSVEKASYFHGIITFVWKDKSQNGSSSNGSEVTEEDANT